eukprot:SAG22_NODE_7128_length_772_cov_7.536404_2_plen_54_part_00
MSTRAAAAAGCSELSLSLTTTTSNAMVTLVAANDGSTHMVPRAAPHYSAPPLH